MNLSVLLSTGSGLTWAGLWWYADDVDFADTKLVAGDFNGDGKSDLAYLTPRGPGVNLSILLSTGSAFSWAGLWWYDSGVDFGNVKLVGGDFDADGKSDVAYLTPRGQPGVNLSVLLSTGTGLTWVGLWWHADDVDFNKVKLLAGRFNADAKTDVGYLTPRGQPGVNLSMLLSSGTAFSHAGLWWYADDADFGNIKLVGGDFNGDGKTDVGYLTPRGQPGVNLSILLSTGSALSYAGLWWYADDVDFNKVKLVAGHLNTDCRTDVGYLTPRGQPGVNFSVLLSTGSALAHAGLWWYDDGVAFGSTDLASGDSVWCPAPTAVEVETFIARRTRAGVLTRWTMASEARVAGYNLFRLAHPLVKLNRSLILVRPRGNRGDMTYQYLDRRGSSSDSRDYKLQAVRIDGTRSWLATARVRSAR